ncbi:terminase TerL endonuclease subunit [Lactobacillus gasseri]|uniref:terminase large subunit n=1 Tax=Lactobacillus gasseri TaxID=1596 RepID=UPI0028EFA40F|nr:terminase TerL endonuclease subunit [Lactobacillus gasseri]MDT9589676.1 terminase TerL endonuclease subunit [Lactobacillus gasseri]MDT9610943.1 terminase TerL endonuclease subunit [Lactobacillus gasseri]
MKIDLTQTHDVEGAYKSIDWSDIKAKYRDPATLYAFSVLNCTKIAGYKIKLACLRHLMDLKRQGQPDFPYHYDVEEANRLLTFAKICPNVDTGEPTKLMEWQEFTFALMFGWRDADGNKRFTRVIDSVARGQGKTYQMAILVCYSFLIESVGLSNQDYLVASINFKQTMKLFGYVASMMRKIIQIEPFKSYANEVNLYIQSDQIIMKKNNNVLRAISLEAGQYDSYHFRTAIFDEIGEVKSRETVSKIISGQVKVPNHQFIQISTSYPDPTVPFHEDQKMIIQAMEQDWKRDADSYLGLIWSQDSLDETYKPETWVKSNPLLDLPDQRDNLMKGLKDKRDSDLLTGNISDFQTKNLNLWLKQSTDSYLNLRDVEDAVDDDFKIDGREVFIGFDYSMFSDNTALGFVYPYGDGKFHLEQHSFIPWQHAGSIEAKEKQDGIAYRNYPEYCTITAHPQGIINPEQIYRWLLNYVEQHQLKVKFFGYDRFGSYQVKNITESLNVNTDWYIMDIQQRTSALANPTKFLQELFVTHKVSIPNDPVMQKALLNAVIKADKIGIQVDKDKATLKIDVVDALIDALFQGMYYFDENADLNNKDTEIDRMTEQQVLDWFKNPNSGLLGGETTDN